MRRTKIPKDNVLCYRNLHRQMFSVQCAATRLVIGHATSLLLNDVQFIVSEVGRQRVLREKSKNVHAKVAGKLAHNEAQQLQVEQDGVRVMYNPYLYDSFVTEDGKRLRGAQAVILYDGRYMKAFNPIYQEGENNV